VNPEQADPAGSSQSQAQDSVTIRLGAHTILAVIVLVAVAYLLFRIPHFWLIVLTALVLATAIDSPVTWLRQRGIPRPLGVLAVYVLLIGVLMTALLALAPVVAGDARALERDLPAYADQIESAVARFFPAVAGDFSVAELEQTLRSNASGLALRVTAIGVEVGRTAVYAFVTMVVAFFLAVDPDAISRQMRRIIPPAHQPRVARVATNIHDRIGAWARGQLLIAVIFGALMGAGLRALGVPYAWSLGIVAGTLEVVPYVGGAITVVLASVSAATVGLPHVVGVIVLYVVLVNIESHILAPVLYGRALGLPPVVILLALLAGVELLGILGALLAIPLTVIAWALAEEFVQDPR